MTQKETMMALTRRNIRNFDRSNFSFQREYLPDQTAGSTGSLLLKTRNFFLIFVDEFNKLFENLTWAEQIRKIQFTLTL